MRRADRLFDIMQILRNRGRSRVTLARELAETLEVSQRTIYRDIADLMKSGVAIDGEAGIGYMLRDGFDLPPMNFDSDEIESLLLGSSILAAWADPGLARAAKSVLQKVEAVLPDDQRDQLYSRHLGAPPSFRKPEIRIDSTKLREAIRNRQRVHIAYEDENGNNSIRVIRPLAMVFFPPNWLIAAWCERRNDFRSFRTDRIITMDIDGSLFEDEPGQGLDDFITRNQQSRAALKPPKARL